MQKSWFPRRFSRGPSTTYTGLMFRYLLVVLALWAAIMIIRHLYRTSRRRSEASDSAQVPADMVRCARCGLHVPKSEAVCDGERCFCSEAHRREGAE